jgi:hypothetical protein
MKTILKSISYLGLALTVLSPLLVWNGKISIETNKTLLIIGMFLWFGSAIFWIKHDPSANA